jgi:hypothetical protein
MNPLLERYRRVLGYLLPRAGVWLAALLAVVLLLAGNSTAGALLALATLAYAGWWYLTHPGADAHPVARALIAAAAATTVARSSGWSWQLVGCLVILGAALMAEPTVRQATRAPLAAWRLPGLRQPWPARFPEPLFLCTSAGVAALTLAALGASGQAAVAVAGAVPIVGLVVAGYQLVRVRRHAAEQEIRAALRQYAPGYAVYYAGPAQGTYQVGMWLPYLERTGERGVVVVRDQRALAAVRSLGDLPVVLARSVESLEWVVVEGLGALFYVNNDLRNVDGVRFGGVTHVHLGHGDSDKPASYAASTAMFDKIFVAGQAGVDRFAQHGVDVPRAKFELVGRPQIERIEVAGPGTELPDRPVVLYAPTWRGGLQDSLFGSLRAGERIVAALIEAGATVWFRPHPYSARDAESRVLIGQIDARLAADTSRPHRRSGDCAELTIFDCMNASDALVTDISSVASDYLYSNKPFAITSTGAGDPTADYPVARAAVLLSTDGDLAAPVAALLGPDLHREDRTRLRHYYLGDWPPDEYADVFVAAALRAIREPRATH